MTNDELRTSLAKMGISQAELSRLLDVTTRAVSMWMASDRVLPGPVEAYVRLLQSLPEELQAVELGRLRRRRRQRHA